MLNTWTDSYIFFICYAVLSESLRNLSLFLHFKATHFDTLNFDSAKINRQQNLQLILSMSGNKNVDQDFKSKGRKQDSCQSDEITGFQIGCALIHLAYFYLFTPPHPLQSRLHSMITFWQRLLHVSIHNLSYLNNQENSLFYTKKIIIDNQK